MAFEKAVERRSKIHRRIRLPDGTVRSANTDPVEIARELRTRSGLGRRERKLAEAEAKRG
jgi:hypothetical protein